LSRDHLTVEKENRDLKKKGEGVRDRATENKERWVKKERLKLVSAKKATKARRQKSKGPPLKSNGTKSYKLGQENKSLTFSYSFEQTTVRKGHI